MLQLVYTSAATRRFDEAALATLLERARARNHALGITGMLLHHQGTFLQVLEGPEAAVEALYAKIGADPRHKNAMVLQRRTIEERDFGDWEMGFVAGARLKRLPGFSDFLATGGGLATLSAEAAQVTRILSQFRQGRWRRAIAA
jgi:hypothetical protein